MSLAGLNAAAPESSRRRSDAVAWLRVLFPELGLPVHSSDDDLRARLADGAVLCGVLRRLCPTLLSDEGRAAAAAGTVTDNNVGRFLAAVEKIGIQSFSPSDLEKGSMSSVVACLLALRDRFGTRVREDRSMSSLPRCESGGRNQLETKLQTMVTSPVMSEPSSPLSRSESSSPSLVFQPKQGGPGDLSGGKVSDIMRSTSLDNAPTQSILSVANSILDGSVERKNGEIPYRVACLLRKVILEIERRISTQAEHMRSQNNLIKAREEKYQSRIKVLEALASGATGQTQVNSSGAIGQTLVASTYVQQKKMDKDKVEDKGKLVEEDMVWLMKYKEDVVRLTKEKEHMVRLLREKEDMIRLMNEKEDMVHLKKVIIDGRQTTNEDADRSIKEKDDIVVRLTKEKEEVVRLLKEKEDVIRLMKEKEEMVRLMKEKGDIASLKEGNVEDRKQSEDENADRLLKQKDDIVVRLTKEKEEMARLLKEKEDLIRLMEKEEMVRSTKQEAIASLKKGKVEDRKQSADEEADRAIKEKDDIVRLMKEKEDNGSTITKLRQELEAVQSSYEESCRLLESKKEDVVNLLTDKENGDTIILQLRQELEATKRLHETHSQQLEARVAQANMELEQRIKEIELMLEDSRKKRRELVELSESRIQIWKQKEATVNQFVGLQAQNVQDLRLSSVYVRHEILNCQKRWSEELAGLGQSLKVVTNAAENYHAALAENRKLFNEVQELKGNIRVYCRIRPFLPGEDQKSTSVEYIGDNGELVLANPTKQGKEGSKNFTFNKVFGPTTTQDDVFKDIQPLIRSVLDGYNVCIFAYGQTGAGKTYTMMGPENATEKEWGVNYRALNDLFNISNTRQDTITYELGVQMVEIYNEQIRDLLGSGGSQKKLGIQNTVQPNGLAVPDATMCPVSSTSHVIDLMQTGHNNRAMSATALNERSSRSHSVVTIHVRGQDLKTGATLRGSLHLVDLAGSERVDRSAVTGDRLREAQHINKSLSALGDVIFSLSQKNAHVPYRNSKLTQVLQTSLGGHAKTLMFVQVNPDVTSYTETLSTLKFAERVSGVELGVARTNKEGKDVKELMEQLSLLKDTIAKKDEEIDQLQLLNTHSPRSKSVKHAESLKHSSSSPGMSSLGKVASIGSGARSDLNDFSDSDRHSEAGSMMSADDIQQQREAMKLSAGETDPELPGDADSEGRLSDVSDGGFSAGVETDGPVSSVVEPEQERTPGAAKDRLSKVATRVQKLTALKAGQGSNLRPKPRDPPAAKSSMPTGTRRSTTTQATSSSKTTSTLKRGP